MNQPLPLKNFERLHDVENFDVLNIPDQNDTGYILEVDLNYPSTLHDNHSDFPLAPEMKIPPNCLEKRLLATLYDKEKYIIHYRNLKQYVQLEMKISKIHRILQFEQTPFLKPYVDLNTSLRQKATTEFQKNFFKLMNNSIFGKTMESIRRRANIRICCNEKKAEKLTAQSNFVDRTLFSENLAAFEMRKAILPFNNPITIEMAILDVSKILMYDFHCNFMKSKYKNNLKLLYTDTDSLIYDVETEDIFVDIKNNIEYFDTSDYPENIYFIPRINKKNLGKMKDEAKGKLITEFAWLRSKVYSYKVEEEEATKKSKGIKKSVIDRKIQFTVYKTCLFENKELLTKMIVI
ncbi:hypothetical protein AVEN_250299-1 [Araneus ventricosus]|uniref:DNA-directed DNA polymerase n=1 Tax=Araneus ventricosus TaxID=182803 RepID=A0A4Y2FIQ3_ARAVE|nr:hypothetical protein AVEN_250299-1 [Araneus ventricosus]